MKLRILNDSIRLRLSQTEVDIFGEKGCVSAEIAFGNNRLKYTVAALADTKDVTANFANNEIIVGIPSEMADKWMDPTEVGFENKDQSQMRILVEKDFQCLHKRPGEDESDSFPNPQATHNKTN